MAKDTKIKDTPRVLLSTSKEDELGKYFFEYGTEEAIPKSREYIPLCVDEACVEPCKLLYDMGLRTVASGANVDGKDNCQDKGYIAIDYKSLSDENKLIAKKLEENGLISHIDRDPNHSGSFRVTIETPLTSETTVGEVEEKLMAIARLFQPQDVLYGRKSEEDIRNDYKDNGDGTYYSDFLRSNITAKEMEEFIEGELQELHDNYFYDGEKYYYLSEELLNIHMEYNKSKNLH